MSIPKSMSFCALTSVCAALSFAPVSAGATAEIYSYTGNTFLFIGGCCGVSNVSGSFTVPSVLAPNATVNLAGTITDYSFSDGRTSWNLANDPGAPVPPFNTANEFLVKTGAFGNIVSWQINIVSNNPAALITTQSLDYAGVGGTVDATNVYNNYVAYSVAAGNPNGQHGLPGTWTMAPVPEPTSGAMWLAGLSLLGFAARRARRDRA